MMSTVALGVLIFYALACALLSSGCMANRLMFHPPQPTYGWKTPGVVKLDTPSGSVAALWLPNAASDKVLVYFHGNAEDLGFGHPVYVAFRDAGMSVLCVDYPGYGPSDGSPSEQGLYGVADAAHAYLTRDLGIAETNLVAMGLSIGGGPACYFAEKHPAVDGLILQSAFTSAFRTVTRVRLFPSDPFPNIARIGNIPCRKLFLHGDADTIVPHSHAKAMHAKAREPKTLVTVPGAGHNDLVGVMGFDRYVELVAEFVARR
ncbi:MAG: alpha/beta hydrolase [Kiritimatiellia bacterium]